MVDLGKITNEKDFQRLVNHLFAIECNSPAFIPSSPYIGFDNGWDGYYEGFYPSENLEGLFSIQSKWTQKNFSEAEGHLKSEISKEIDKAIKNKVEHLRIATTAELRVDQVKALENLKPKEIKSLHVWHRENLKIRIERQPFLRNSYFGDPQHPLLVPASLYFDDLEKQLIDVPAHEITAFKSYIEEFQKFMASDKHQLFVVHAPGGFGKSHLLREIATLAYEYDPTRQPWMLKTGYRSFEAAIQEEIDPKQKYLLILDDADRDLNTLNPLLAFLTKSGVDIKVVLSLRTSGIYILQDRIQEFRASGFTTVLKINEWPKDDLLKLLRACANKDRVNDEEIIVHDFPNPYFIVLIGKRIRGDGIKDFSKIKAEIIEDIIVDAKKSLADVFQDGADELLLNLACIVPFNKDNQGTIDEIAKQLNKSSDLIKKAIDRLVQSNILRQVGRAIRFSPDMRGDVYLLYKLEQLSKEYLKNLVLQWMPLFSKNIFVNLGATFKYGQANIISAMLEEFINEWIDKAKDTSGTERRERLEWLKNVVEFIPKGCLDLINTYFDFPPPQETSFLYPDDYRVVLLSTDDYGPAIDGLIRSHKYRNEILCLIERLYSLEMKGTYDNYKPLTLIKDCVSPLRNDVDSIVEMLNLMEKWLDEPNKNRADMVKSALSEVLAATHEYSRSYLDKMEFGERPLPNNPKVLQMRDAAMALLDKLLTHANIEYQLCAIDVVSDIGKTRMGHVSPSQLPLAERFVQEKIKIIDDIGRLIHPNTDFRLLSDIEDLFLHWWAQDAPGIEKITELLKSIPRSPEYELFRYFSSRLDIVQSFEEVSKDAPQANKWPWLVENVMSKKWYLKSHDFSRPVQQLNQEYSSAELIAKFVNRFAKKIEPLNSHLYPIFIYCWVELNSDAFREIRDNTTLWQLIPDYFKMEIDGALTNLDPNHLQRLANEILSDINKATDERISTLLHLITIKQPRERSDWSRKLIGCGNDKIISKVVRNLYFVFKENKNVDDLMGLLLLALNEIKNIDNQFVDNVSFLTHSLKDDFKKHKDINKLVKALYDLIKDRPELEWHDQEIVEFCIGNVDELIAFIDYRLKESKTHNKRAEFEAIPYDGIKHLSGSIQSYEDYRKFLSQSLEWHNIYSEGVEYYDVQKILKPILFARNNKTNQLYITEYINELVQKKQINEILICAQYLPLNGETVDLFLRISEEGIKSDNLKTIRSLLFSKTYPEGGWSSSGGQAPPALLEKKRIYEEMQKKTSLGALSNLLKRCADSVEQSIKEHLDVNKEFLASRG
ncbi:MAG: hypothetical protein Q8O71_03950 [bacterium]|nr:hypothetical protein [bacterium]